MPKKSNKNKTTKRIKKGSLEKAQLPKEIQFPKTKPQSQTSQTRIKIIGVGGGGNSIVSEIARLAVNSKWGKNFKKIDFVAINTDLQALSKVSKYCKALKIGGKLTQGLGCGMDPGLGRRAALSSREEIRKYLEGADFCLLVVCLGGGTGSGAAPAIAEIARSLKMVSLGIFTLPFKFEGEKKATITRNSLKKMKPNLNAVNIIPNEKIFQIIEKNTPLKTALSVINQRLTFALGGLMNMIYSAGLINLDWADFKTILEGRGRRCYLNRVENSGESAAQIAAKEAVRNPLNDYGLEGADRILFNIEGAKFLKMQEVGEISQFIFNFNKKAKIIFGVSLAETSAKNLDGGNRIGITLLATGRDRAPGKNLISPKTKRFPVSPQKKEKKKNVGSVASEKKAISGSKTKKISIKKSDLQPEKKSTVRTQPTIHPLFTHSTQEDRKKKRGGFVFSLRKKKPTVPTVHTQHIQPTASSQQKPTVPTVRTQHTQHTQAEIESPLQELSRGENRSRSKTIRKNALTLKKEIEKAEKEILAAEKKWDPPAFLRKNKNLAR